MEFSAEQIAGILEGEIVGNKDQTVSGLSKIEEGENGTLSFLANQKYEDFIYTTDASIVRLFRMTKTPIFIVIKCLFCFPIALQGNVTRQYSTILTCRETILVCNQQSVTPARLKKLLRVEIIVILTFYIFFFSRTNVR